MQRFERNIVAGCLVVIPLVVTYWIISLVLDVMVAFGRPPVNAIAGWLQPFAPDLAEMLRSSQFEWILAALVTLAALYFVGSLTTRVVGRRLIAAFDRMIARIPFVTTLYGAVRKLIATFQNTREGDQRVVLIDFPSPEMKAIGLVTRTFIDADTGLELAAVYVPTTPVPSAGFMEIVPVDRLVWLDWSLNDAMQFIISGGALAPDTIRYGRPPPIARSPAGRPVGEPVGDD